MNALRFFVFSYNRGEFLANCVRSIEECVPEAGITVVDDRSTDRATQEELASIERRHRVIHAGTGSGRKHGGLYRNMQAALDGATDETLACFVQDDTQVVRRLDDDDVTALTRRFEQCPDLGFVSPCFMRGRTRQRNPGMAFRYDPALDLFFPGSTGRSAGIYYSDVCIVQVERLRAAGWRFASGEPANQRAAMGHFRPMGYLRCPFMMWLPNVPAYRGRAKSLALRWAEHARGCGLYPLAYIPPEAIERLATASGEHPPVAEEWLAPVGGPIVTPWIYDPLQGSRWLKHLDRLELGVRRAGRAIARGFRPARD